LNPGCLRAPAVGVPTRNRVAGRWLKRCSTSRGQVASGGGRAICRTIRRVQRHFYAWRGDGTLQRINFKLLMQARADADASVAYRVLHVSSRANAGLST
jgi:hypothetical protein